MGARFQLDLRIFGSEGALLYDIDRARLAVFRDDGASQEFDVGVDDGAYRCDGPPHELVELTLGLTDSNSSPGDVGRRAVEIVHAAYESHTAGRRVAIDELERLAARSPRVGRSRRAAANAIPAATQHSR